MDFNSILSIVIALLPLIAIFVWLTLPKHKREEKTEESINNSSLRFFLAFITIVLVIPLIVLKVNYAYIIHLVFVLDVIIPMFVKKIKK